MANRQISIIAQDKTRQSKSNQITFRWSSGERKGIMRVTILASLPRTKKAALKRGLIEVPVIHGKLSAPTEEAGEMRG